SVVPSPGVTVLQSARLRPLRRLGLDGEMRTMQFDGQDSFPGVTAPDVTAHGVTTTRRLTRRHLLLMLGAAASLPLAAACGQQANVPIEVIEIGTSDYGKKIPAAIESKTMPDVLEAGDDWTVLLQGRGLVADLSDIYQKIDQEQKWAPGAKAISTFPDGKQ